MTKEQEKEILKEYIPPKCDCSGYVELKWVIYDGGLADSGALMFWQCTKCGVVLKTRITDAKKNF